jgi:hypothetical protein
MKYSQFLELFHDLEYLDYQVYFNVASGNIHIVTDYVVDENKNVINFHLTPILKSDIII